MKKVLLNGLIILCVTLCIVACNNETIKTKKIDLVAYGIPLTVKAPVNATVFQPSGKGEVWIEDTTVNFYVQVRKAISLSGEVAKAKTEELEIVKAMDGFSKIIMEEENGFIYETKFGEVFYDFKYLLIQGDSKYIFQKNFAKESTLMEVEQMYEIIK